MVGFITIILHFTYAHYEGIGWFMVQSTTTENENRAVAIRGKYEKTRRAVWRCPTCGSATVSKVPSKEAIRKARIGGRKHRLRRFCRASGCVEGIECRPATKGAREERKGNGRTYVSLVSSEANNIYAIYSMRETFKADNLAKFINNRNRAQIKYTWEELYRIDNPRWWINRHATKPPPPVAFRVAEIWEEEE